MFHGLFCPYRLYYPFFGTFIVLIIMCQRYFLFLCSLFGVLYVCCMLIEIFNFKKIYSKSFVVSILCFDLHFIFPLYLLFLDLVVLHFPRFLGYFVLGVFCFFLSFNQYISAHCVFSGRIPSSICFIIMVKLASVVQN